MSFRKFNSFTKSEKKTMSVDTSSRPFESLIRLFTRNTNDVAHKRNESCSFSTKSSNIAKKAMNEFDFLWNLEIVLIYTENLIRQKIDDLNRKNIIQQFIQCAKFIDLHLKESQSYVDNLNVNVSTTQDIKECLEIFKFTHTSFTNWIENVQHNDDLDLSIGQDLFLSMQVKAQKFINFLKFGLWDLNKDCKRSSIDNSSLIPTSLKSLDSDSSRKSCFNEEDRKLINEIKKLDKNIDLPPPKPALPKFAEDSIDSYLNQLEQIIQSRKESEYDYPSIYTNNQLKSVKIENNCIMASSNISNDIPPVDMEASDEFTPTPIMTDSLTNGFSFAKEEEEDPIPQPVCQERSRNFPLPPLPSERKSISRCKLASFTSNFPSEEVHYRKASMAEEGKSQVTNGVISNFSYRSPLRSPILISSIKSQNSKFPPTKLPVALKDCHSNNSILSPSSLSQRTEEGTNFHSISSSRQLLMAKQIPSIVNDPNDLLNINDMQDDIEIITRSFDPFIIENKTLNRISDVSNQTNISTQSEPQPQNEDSSLVPNNNDAYCNSEVKSDTEEYFEYFEIDGRKYRRKMKKRTVIEKIKIRKTILAPMKPDGSGPDLLSFKDIEENDSLTNNEFSAINEEKQIEYNEPSNEVVQHPRFRRGNEDRLRVSKSMFYPYRDETKRMTLCSPPNLKNDSNNKLFPLMNKYMYRFGQSNFEEPIIDKRFSTQLTDAVYSTWFKTSESILPHEKSKSICYLKKSRQKNEDGATVQNEVRVTASRTIRMKIPDVNQSPSTPDYFLPTLAITNNQDEESSIIDGDDSDTSLCDTDTSLCGTDRISDPCDSYIQSSDDEKEEDGENISDSVSSEHEIKQSNRSTIEDPDLHDLNLDEFEESISVKSERSAGSDSLFYSHHSSTVSDTKDDYSSILEENNATQYLIFDEESKYGECDIAGGPVDALIVYACDGKEHLLFLGAFLDTYRTFIEPEKLISRLVIRYKFYQSKLEREGTKSESQNEEHSPSDYDNPQKKCKHVLSLMLTIIGKLKRDLKEGLFEQVQQFQSYLRDIRELQWVEAISRAIENQIHCMKRDDKFVQRLMQLSNPPLKQAVQKSPSKEFSSPTKLLTVSNHIKPSILSFHSREIAEQMTLLDWSKYRDVELMEILNLKDIVNCNLPGVIEYAKNFENVQYWTQSIFLDPERVSDRDKNCIKFIRIMKHLQRLKNFSSLIAILLAIQLLPIRRMFSKRVQTKIKEYDDYMKPPRFLGYKEDLKNATSPCIPFLGIFYQDIVMLNIANPPYLDLDEMIKNTDKSNFSSNNNQLLLLNTIKCGPVINFWRSFKQYIFLKNCNKDQDKIRYSIEPNEKILQFLNNFKESYDEATIQRMIKQIS